MPKIKKLNKTNKWFILISMIYLRLFLMPFYYRFSVVSVGSKKILIVLGLLFLGSKTLNHISTNRSWTRSVATNISWTFQPNKPLCSWLFIDDFVDMAYKLHVININKVRQGLRKIIWFKLDIYAYLSSTECLYDGHTRPMQSSQVGVIRNRLR